MGALTAAEFAAHAPSLDTAISAHLTSNCFPRVHPDFHPVAIEAVDVAVDAEVSENYELYDETRELPNGRVLSIGEIISQLHLDAIVAVAVNEALGAEEEVT